MNEQEIMEQHVQHNHVKHNHVKHKLMERHEWLEQRHMMHGRLEQRGKQQLVQHKQLEL